MDAARLTEFLECRMRHATDLRVVDLTRITSDWAREKFSFDAEWTEDGERRTRPLILQCDASEREFEVLTAMHRAEMKIPEPLFLELDPAVIGRPFLIAERLPGRTADGATMLAEPVALRRKLADQFIAEMVRLHQLDWRELKLEWLGAPTDLAEPARTQTLHWYDLYHHDRMNGAWPIIDAAFAWLKANPVLADRVSIVHGDLRSGNFLFDDNGLVAMLGWEMMHLGDPLEDLAWATMSLWGHQSLTGGLIDRKEFIRRYETKAGAAIDRKRLFFYQVLGNTKMATMCLTGVRDFIEGRTSDLSMLKRYQTALPLLLEDLAAQLKLV